MNISYIHVCKIAENWKSISHPKIMGSRLLPSLRSSDWNWHNLSNKIVNFKENFPIHQHFFFFFCKWHISTKLSWVFIWRIRPHTIRRNFISDAWFPLHAHALLPGGEGKLTTFQPTQSQRWAWKQPKGKKSPDQSRLVFMVESFFLWWSVLERHSCESWRSALFFILLSFFVACERRFELSSFPFPFLSPVPLNSTLYNHPETWRSTFFTPDKLSNVWLRLELNEKRSRRRLGRKVLGKITI